MKKTRLLLLAVLVLTLAMSVVAACSSNKEKPKSAEIELNYQTYSLDLHEQVQLTATTKNTTEEVKWESSAPATATVDGSGLVKSVKAGKATVTASVGEVKATCEITVTNSGAAPVLELSHSNIGVNKDAEISVNATLKYKGQPVAEAATVNWAVTDGAATDIISVTPAADGKSATVRGLKYGETSFDVSTVIWGTPLKETVKVKVCNTDISFEITGYTVMEGGYGTTIALAETDEYKTETTPAIIVKNKGQVVTDANIVWTADVENVVTVAGNRITAAGAGDVVLTGAYDNNTVKLFIKVVRPTIALAHKVTVETSVGDLELDGGDSVTGTISAVKIGDGENAFDKVEGEVIKLKKDVLPKLAAELGENKSITVETDKAVYTVPADIYTQIINTKEELHGWGAVAKSACSDAKLWDGYFVLGNDIDFEGETYNSFICWDTAQTLSGEEAGFKGVFDGKGHIIDNLVMDDKAMGGFVGLLYVKQGGAHGIIKNLAFTNASGGAYHGFIVSSGGGEVTNVYVSLNKLGAGRNPDYSGVFFSRDMVGWSARVTHCFVEIKDVDASEFVFAIGSKHRRTGSIHGVYAVGYDKAFREISDADWSGEPLDVYGAYKTYADFLADETVDLSDWDTDFWKIVDGIPYPKNLDLSDIPVLETANLTATVSATNVISGAAVDLVGKTVKLVGLNGSYQAEVTASGISVANVVKGAYTVSVDDTFTTANVNFNGDALAISLVYHGATLDARYETESLTFGDVTSEVARGTMTLTDGAGQHLVKLHGGRQHSVLTSNTYDNVKITGLFGAKQGAYNHRLGILIKFADGKGAMLGFEGTGENTSVYKLTFRSDNGDSYIFGLTGQLTGWYGDNGEFTDCKPLKQEWVNKFTSDYLAVSLVRNGSNLIVLVENNVVGVCTLPAEYADKTCQVGFYANWGDVTVPFAVSKTLGGSVEIAATGLDALENGSATLDKQEYSFGDTVTLNITPATNYGIQSVKVDGAIVTDKVSQDGKLVLGCATQDKTYAIEVEFIDIRDAYDVTFTYDKTKFTADGLVITLKKDETTKTVTLGDNAVLQELARGEWAVTTEFVGMTVSLGNVNIRSEECVIDLSKVFSDNTLIKDVDFVNGTFVYATGGSLTSTLTFDIAEGNAYFVTKIRYDKDTVKNNNGWTDFGLTFHFGDQKFTANSMYNSSQGNDYERLYIYEDPSWGGSTGHIDTLYSYALRDGKDLYLIWAYDAAAGSMNLYAALTPETIKQVGTLYENDLPKNSKVTALTFSDPWGSTVSDISVSFAYGAKLADAVDVEKGNLTATVMASDVYGTVNVVGKKLTLSSALGTYEAQITADGATFENVYKGIYTATVEGNFAPTTVTFSGENISLSVLDAGAKLTAETTRTQYSFWGTNADVAKGVVELDGDYGKFNVAFGGNRQNHVETSNSYNNVVVTALFSHSQDAYNDTIGIMLKFADNKGILIGFQIDGSLKLTYRTDNETYKFGMDDTLTGWIGDNGELTSCKPLKQDWADKFNNGYLKLTLVRNGNVLLLYVDDTLVNVHALADEYATKTCNVGFFCNCGNADRTMIPFAVSNDLGDDITVTATGIDDVAHGTVGLDKSTYKLGDKVVLNVTPESGFRVKRLIVGGSIVTDQVKDNKLFIGYATEAKTYDIEIAFIEIKDAYDVTFSYDAQKAPTAAGLAITLKKDDVTKTLTVGDNMVIENLAVGEWAASIQFAGMTVSLGNFNIASDEYAMDLNILGDGASAVNFADGKFDFSLGTNKSNLLNVDLSQGDAFFMNKLKVTEIGTKNVTYGVQMKIGDTTYRTSLYYCPNPANTADYNKMYAFVGNPWQQSPWVDGSISDAFGKGTEVIFVWAYNAETGSIDIYAGLTLDKVAKVGSLYAGQVAKNSKVTAVGVYDEWAGDAKAAVEFKYGTDLGEMLGIQKATFTANVTATNVLGADVSLVGKKVKLHGNYADYEADITASGISLENVYKDSYVVTPVDGANALCDGKSVTFDGTALTLSFDYGVFTEYAKTWEHVNDYDASYGSVTLPTDYGDWATKGGGRQYSVMATNAYNGVKITGKFSRSYSAYNDCLGIVLKFDGGDGVLLGFEKDGDNLKLTYRADNESCKFGLTNVLLPWHGDNDGDKFSPVHCRPLKAEWKAKFDGDGLDVALLRVGKTLQVLVDGTLADSIDLDEKYAAQTCQVGLFANWGGDSLIKFNTAEATELISVPASEA